MRKQNKKAVPASDGYVEMHRGILEAISGSPEIPIVEVIIDGEAYIASAAVVPFVNHKYPGFVDIDGRTLHSEVIAGSDVCFSEDDLMPGAINGFAFSKDLEKMGVPIPSVIHSSASIPLSTLDKKNYPEEDED